MSTEVPTGALIGLAAALGIIALVLVAKSSDAPEPPEPPDALDLLRRSTRALFTVHDGCMVEYLGPEQLGPEPVQPFLDEFAARHPGVPIATLASGALALLFRDDKGCSIPLDGTPPTAIGLRLLFEVFRLYYARARKDDP